MTPVDDYDEIRGGLFSWHGYDSGAKVDLFSTALRAGDSLVFVDPIPLRQESLLLMTAGIEPGAIILTNANHERAAALFRQKFSIPVSAAAESTAAVHLDKPLTDADFVLHSLRCIMLPGAAPGEMAIHSPDHGGILCVGDALINLEPEGLRLLPRKYCEDAKGLKVSLQKLLQFSFEIMTFAHGMPIISGAKSRLQDLLQ